MNDGRRRQFPLALAALVSCAGCSPAPTPAAPFAPPSASEWYDKARNRRVPVVIYRNASGKGRPLAIISNGFGTKNSDYSFLAETLVRRGYVVASIQQDLPGDPRMSSEGNLAVLRRPAWQIGADTIDFVIGRMAQLGLASAERRVVLVGHSNGGDISMLYATEHPERVSVVFTLDNRRMPMPRMSRPRVCSVRSSDYAADPGVLPTPLEQRRYGVRIASIAGLRHDDMSDIASKAQQAAMARLLVACLR